MQNQKTARAPSSHNVSIQGPVGVLEGIVETPGLSAPGGMALLCHPHPLHQGTMHNKVVHTLARSFLTLDDIAVRFNFRGVGGSAGSFDAGAGEESDEIARTDAVIEWLNALEPGPELRIMADTDHFFHGRLAELREGVVEFLSATLPRKIG